MSIVGIKISLNNLLKNIVKRFIFLTCVRRKREKYKIYFEIWPYLALPPSCAYVRYFINFRFNRIYLIVSTFEENGAAELLKAVKNK